MRSCNRFICVLAVAAVSVSGAFALDIDLSASGTAATGTNLGITKTVYPDLDVTVANQSGNFGFLWDLGMDGSGQYGSLFGGNFIYSTVLIKQGGFNFKVGDFSLDVGKLALHDEVDSPYSLALSSLGNSALTGSFRYEDDRFFFTDRWFSLNYDSGQTFNTQQLGQDGKPLVDGSGNPINLAWPDRSVVIKSYGVKAGDFRFGLQDVILFTDLDYGSSQRGPLFDAEYFVNPAPAFFIQYADTRLDSPWQKSTALNDNYLIGFFGTWKNGKYAADVQILVDDFDANMILHPASYQNPNKIAWTLGASMETEYGTFRFDQAGATRYTFESSGYGGEDNLAYGYTYYPDTQFSLDGAQKVIDPEGNNIGYLHGENNIAFMASWSKAFDSLSVAADLEFTLTGSQSPANPWGTDTGFPDGTKLLNDPVLEKKLVVNASASYPWRNFRFVASAELGYAWNRLELVTASAWGGVDNEFENGIAYYAPSSENAFIGALTLGGTWLLKY